MSVSMLQPSAHLPPRPVPSSGQFVRTGERTAPQRALGGDAARGSLSKTGLRRARSENAAAERSPAQELAPDEKREVEKLKKRDREVRAHEAAHKAAAGALSSGSASFSFTRGPDGRRYATSGEVSIDTSEVSGDADATVRKMMQVRSAALAPANPSSQDRKVAAQASSKAQAARAEAAHEKLEEEETERESGAGRAPSSGAAAPPEDARNAETSCSICGGEGHGPELHYSKR